MKPCFESLLHQLGGEIIAGNRSGRIVVTIAGIQSCGFGEALNRFGEAVRRDLLGALKKEPLRSIPVVVAHVLRGRVWRICLRVQRPARGEAQKG